MSGSAGEIEKEKSPAISGRTDIENRHVKEYTEHYPLERNHQGLDNELIERPTGRPDMDAPVECQERLGGILKCYHRRAA